MNTTTKSKLTTVDLVQCGLFVSLIVAGAYIKIVIPLGPFSVTFSLQFLFSLMAGLLMGSKKGAVTVCVYLMLGLVGIPVFAHGGGIGYILRPTFGFLIGFLTAAAISGAIYERLPNPTFKKSLLAAFIGELSYYFCGLVYYYIFFNYVVSNGGLTIGFKELMVVWCFSTFVPDFILCVIAVWLSDKLRPHLPVMNNRKTKVM